MSGRVTAYTFTAYLPCFCSLWLYSRAPKHEPEQTLQDIDHGHFTGRCCSPPTQCWNSQDRLCTNGSISPSFTIWQECHQCMQTQAATILTLLESMNLEITCSFSNSESNTCQTTRERDFQHVLIQRGLDLQFIGPVEPLACLHWFFNAVKKIHRIICCNKWILFNISVFVSWAWLLTSLLLNHLMTRFISLQHFPPCWKRHVDASFCGRACQLSSHWRLSHASGFLQMLFFCYCSAGNCLLGVLHRHHH